MIFSYSVEGYADTVISLSTGWTYLEVGRESEMAEELFDETLYFHSRFQEPLGEIFVREGLLLW